MGYSTHLNYPSHDKFTRHHFLRLLVRGFEELRLGKLHQGKSREINILVSLAIKEL